MTEPLDVPRLTGPTDKEVERQQHRTRRKKRTRILVAVVSALLIVIAVGGTLTYTQIRGQHNSTTLTAQQAVIANQQKEIQGLDSILAYITGSASTKANQQVSLFTLKLLTNICSSLSVRPQTLGQALPSCVIPPYPPLLQQLLAGKLPTEPTTVPSTPRH